MSFWKSLASALSGGLSDVVQGNAPFTAPLQDLGAGDTVLDINQYASDIINPASRGGRILQNAISGDTGWAEALDQIVDIPRFGGDEDSEQGLIDYGFREMGDIQPQWFKDTMSSVGTGIGAYVEGPGGAAVMGGLADKAQQGPIPKGMGTEDRNKLYRRGFKNAGTAATLAYLLGGDAGADFDVAMMGDTLSTSELAELDTINRAAAATEGGPIAFDPNDVTYSDVPQAPVEPTHIGGTGDLPETYAPLGEVEPIPETIESPRAGGTGLEDAETALTPRESWVDKLSMPDVDTDTLIKVGSKLADLFKKYGQTGGGMQSVETGVFGGTPTPTNEWVNYLSGGGVSGKGKLMAGAGEAGLGDVMSSYVPMKDIKKGYNTDLYT